MSWIIREFQLSDLDACIAVMRSNLPTYFAHHELEEFVSDLEARAKFSPTNRWPYFVLATGNHIRACGGYAIDQHGVASLVWGMVHASEHKRGLGTALFNYRLMHLANKALTIEIDTSPASFGFYHRLGFKQTGIVKDGYRKGLDKVYAQLRL